MFGDVAAEKGDLTSLGLKVAFKGYRIEPGGLRSLTDAAIQAFGADGDLKTLFLRDLTGTWYDVSMGHDIFPGEELSLKKTLRDRSKKWYIILRGARVVSNPTFQTGLLCYQTPTPKGNHVYNSLITLHVSQMRPAFQTLREACHPHALAIRQTRTGKYLQYIMAYHNAFCRFTSQIPWPVRNILVTIHDTIFQTPLRYFGTYLDEEMRKRTRQLLQTPEITEALEKTNLQPISVFEMIASIFWGRAMQVTREFEKESEWVVD